MPEERYASRLDHVTRLLHVSALELSRHCDVSSSLVSRWKKGERPLTARSKALPSLCEALLAMDEEDVLREVLAPYRTGGESKAEALAQYLTAEELPALPARAAPVAMQYSGSYIAQQQVLLGEKGVRRAALLMLDYVMRLPPGRQVLMCAHNGFDLWLKNIPFALQFLQKMRRAVARGTSFQLVNRRGFGMNNSAHFAGLWLVAHLKGSLRSRYYEGPPPEEYFVACIPGYWSGRAERDDTAEDGLIATLYTDPRNIRKDEAHCAAYVEKSAPASQYGFFKNPLGDGQTQGSQPGWQPGPLPMWETPDAKAPTGNFFAICRVPVFGVMTRAEYAEILKGEASPPLPDYLFCETGGFAQGPHKIILCREDMREGLRAPCRKSEPLSALLGREAYVPREMLAAQLRRLLAAMAKNEEFEVALVPRAAFAKLELEIVCWQNSAAVGWLQDCSESVFANDPITSGSFAAAVEYTWGRLHQGWKKKRSVRSQLNKWLAGEELDKKEEDSVLVKNWDALPKA